MYIPQDPKVELKDNLILSNMNVIVLNLHQLTDSGEREFCIKPHSVDENLECGNIMQNVVTDRYSETKKQLKQRSH